MFFLKLVIHIKTRCKTNNIKQKQNSKLQKTGKNPTLSKEDQK